MSEPIKHKKRRPQSEWQQIMADYERSGLTQEAFCEPTGIPKSSFYNWRKRLAAQPPAIEPAQFIDLNALVQREDKPRWSIKLDLGNGMRLSLRGG